MTKFKINSLTHKIKSQFIYLLDFLRFGASNKQEDSRKSTQATEAQKMQNTLNWKQNTTKKKRKRKGKAIYIYMDNQQSPKYKIFTNLDKTIPI